MRQHPEAISEPLRQFSHFIAADPEGIRDSQVVPEALHPPWIVVSQPDELDVAVTPARLQAGEPPHLLPTGSAPRRPAVYPPHLFLEMPQGKRPPPGIGGIPPDGRR